MDRLDLYGLLHGAMVGVCLYGFTFRFGRKGRFGQPVSKTYLECAIRWAGVAVCGGFLAEASRALLTKGAIFPIPPADIWGLLFVVVGVRASHRCH